MVRIIDINPINKVQKGTCTSSGHEQYTKLCHGQNLKKMREREREREFEIKIQFCVMCLNLCGDHSVIIHLIFFFF